MYAVAFKSQDNKQLDLSVVADAGYALILPWMPVPVSMITLTQVVSGSSTVVARAAIGREIPDLKHLALTVDGMQAKVYFRGRLLMTGTLSTTMSIDRIELQGGTKDTLLSEMLLMSRVASQEDIAMWHNLRAPFYDPSPHIPAEHQPVTVKGAGADIDIDKFGIRATRKADGKKTFEIDAETGDARFAGDISGASGTFGNGSIYIGEDGLRAEKNGNTTFEIDSEGNAYFSGEISAASILSNSLLLSALTDFSWVTASNEVTAGSSWSTIPGMTLQVTVDSPTVLFIIANSGAIGAAYYEFYDPSGILWKEWADAEVRLRVNGSVRVTSHKSPYVSPMFHIENVNPGTHTIQMEWRGDWTGFSRVRASYRGIYVLKLRR